ncbi:MAG: hypothetical protein ACFB0G_04450 [Leptolyngbyaceae cyanobacterium]
MGQGTDDFFLATFEPADAERLAVLVRQHLPALYVHGCSLAMLIAAIA